jgi:hypothetical protein
MKCRLGELSVPGAKPVNVEIQDGGQTHTGIFYAFQRQRIRGVE